MVKRIITAGALWCAVAQPLAAETFSLNGFVGVETRSFLRAGHAPSSISSAVAELRSRGQLSDTLSYDLRLYGRENFRGLGGGYIDPTVAKLTWQSGSLQIDLG